MNNYGYLVAFAITTISAGAVYGWIIWEIQKKLYRNVRKTK